MPRTKRKDEPTWGERLNRGFTMRDDEDVETNIFGLEPEDDDDDDEDWIFEE